MRIHSLGAFLILCACDVATSHLPNAARIASAPTQPNDQATSAQVAWAGNWGAGDPGWGAGSTPCGLPAHGLNEPVLIDPSSYNIGQRVCSFVSAEVYVPGLPLSADSRSQIQAFVDWTVDGAAHTSALTYGGFTGNNFEYLWNLQAEALPASWRVISYTFRFSTDGATWYRIGLGDGPVGGLTRTLLNASPPTWMGNFTVKLSRDDTDPCSGGTPVDSGFVYDTWVRSRALARNLCFEVWQPGVTDWSNPDLWQELDVEIYYRLGGGDWVRSYVGFAGYVGNNARYIFDIGSIDPFRDYNCPGALATTTVQVSGAPYIDASLDYYVIVNGGREPGLPTSTLAGTFQDYSDSPWRDANCR